jgi:BirA family biotin operon repressor/biotin-[acetyl-CoA-carboxylase] ligase
VNSLRIRLLQELLNCKTGYVSGEELSERLLVSRTAIWKHIEELRKEGYDIDAQRKQGYRLESIPTTLSESALLPFLDTSWLGKSLYVYNEIDSTQVMAQKLAREGAPSGTVVIADRQTAGKGRMGRKWHSSYGAGIWMSLILRPDIPLSATPQLTLLSSVAVLKGIMKSIPLELGIKWPNDLLINNKKVSGILTELNAETDQVNYVVVGVGINVNQETEHFPEEIRGIATSLRIESGSILERNQVILNVLKEVETLYDLYIEHGFSPIKTLWEAHALSIGRRIIARTPHGTFEGIAQGITQEGVLLLEDVEGHIHKIYSADIETG